MYTPPFSIGFLSDVSYFIKDVIICTTWYAVHASIAAHRSLSVPIDKPDTVLREICVPQVEVRNIKGTIGTAVFNRVSIEVL